jgi:hypothetical protein
LNRNVATIERGEDNRRARLSHGVTLTSAAVDVLAGHHRGPRFGGNRLDGSRPALVGACELYGVTPLHVAAWKHVSRWLVGFSTLPAYRQIAKCHSSLTPMQNKPHIAEPFIALLPLAAQYASAARLINVTFEGDGRALMVTYYEDGGLADAATV